MDETKRRIISRGFTRINADKEKAEGSKQKAETLIKERGQARLPDLELTIHDAETLD